MRITHVEYVSGYQLKLTFSNKETKIVDLAEKMKHAKGVFVPLKDVEFFKQVVIDDCQLSICWPNGADICPDVLYEMGRSVSSSKAARKKSTKRSPRKISRISKRASLN
jgi:hypothetical protein